MNSKKSMRIHLENKQVIDLLHILGDTYDELTLQLELQKKGMHQPHWGTQEQTEDLLFNTASLLVEMNEQAHYAGICNCTDDSKIERQRDWFEESFKSRIATERFLRHIEEHGGFQVASPPSPTSSLPSVPGSSIERPARGKLPESFGELKNKRPRTP